MTICVFLSHAHGTYTFRDAEIKIENETVLVVEYTAMSDGRKKVLTAQKSQIMGWSESPA